jgi:type II secretory pathway pseudopilin PulG
MPYCAYCGTQLPRVSFAPCPSCGSPSNGAPRPVAGTNALPIVAIVLVVVLGVVAVVGILAAIAIPNLLTAMQRSKQKRSMADIRTIATAVEAYAVDNKRYPAVSAYNELNGILAPTYIRVVPTLDGWGQPFRYESWSNSYAIGSGAKDGQFEHDSLREYAPGGTTNFNNDIIFSNGVFVRYPEGAQVQ